LPWKYDVEIQVVGDEDACTPGFRPAPGLAPPFIEKIEKQSGYRLDCTTVEVSGAVDVSDILSSAWTKFAALAGAVGVIVGLGSNLGAIRAWMYPPPAGLTVTVHDVSGVLSPKPPYSLRAEAELFKSGNEKLSCQPFVRVDGSTYSATPFWRFDEKDQQLRSFKAHYDMRLDEPIAEAEFKVECLNWFESSRHLPPTEWKKFSIY
jgi:hypothetical protein